VVNAMAVDLSKSAGEVVQLAPVQQNLTPPTASETQEALALQG